MFMNRLLIIFLLHISFFGNAQIAQHGWMDLSSIDWEKDKVRLDGEWHFYWKALIPPDSIDTIEEKKWDNIIVPGVWKAPFTAEGYGTYHLKVYLGENYPTLLGVKLQTFATAYRLYVNGKLLDKEGVLSVDPEKSEGGFNPKAVFFAVDSSYLDILIQVSNYDHRNGGMWREILIGSEAQIQYYREKAVVKDVLFFGILLIMGVYFMVFHMMHRQDKAMLYFSMGSTFLALRELVTDEYLLQLWCPGISWLWLLRLEYLSFVAVFIAFPLFLKEILSTYISDRVTQSTVYAGGVFVVVLLFFPPNYFTYLSIITYSALLVFWIFVIQANIKAIKDKMRGGSLLLTGMIVVLLSCTNDFLISLSLFSTPPMITISVLVFMILMAILLSYRYIGVFSNNQRLTIALNKANAELEFKVAERTRLLSLSNSELEIKNREVESNKKVLEARNKEITSSINYASRIQQATLPTPQKLDELIGVGRYTLLYMPKDVVAGDFYYVEKHAGKLVIIVADSTGHGVPGALLSMMGMELVKDIVEVQQVLDPSRILSMMHSRVRSMLQQRESGNFDGIELAVCVFAEDWSSLQFAGAHRPLVYIKNGEVMLIKGEKYGVGGVVRGVERIYPNHELRLDEVSAIYLFSDGYPDQFGGQYNRKFTMNRLKNILLKQEQEPMERVAERLRRVLEEWIQKGGDEQIDDVLLLGVRICNEE
ncbi:7TM diverse intracellular signaling domain-containing protein [Algivirga pacifica]